MLIRDTKLQGTGVVAVLVAAIEIIVVAMLARVGWEFGEKLWRFL